MLLLLFCRFFFGMDEFVCKVTLIFPNFSFSRCLFSGVDFSGLRGVV